MSDQPRPLPDWPRGLSEALAAAYVGLAESTFRREVTAGRAPRAVRITPGRCVWLRDHLDAWLDGIGGIVPASPPADDWEAASRGTDRPAVSAHLP